MKKFNMFLIMTIVVGSCGIMYPASAQFEGKIESIPPHIQKQIVGKSWEQACPISLSDLRYLTIGFWGYDSKKHLGEMIVHKDIAQEVIEIFRELFSARFPIEKMRLVDLYFREPENRPKGEIDDASVEDNNTSAFFFRYIGKTTIVSEHGLGTAIDINPRVNPFVRGQECCPENGREFCDRTRNDVPGLITIGSICYNAFMSRGWKWGGHWKNVKDYQHFCKQEIIPASFNE